MNEPPAGRKARNYRPDQRPHAARPGRQRDLAPLKGGERGAGRPGAGHRFRSGLLGRRAPLLPPGPQLPPGVATTSGHERPGRLGWGWGRHGGRTGEPPAEPAPRAPASGAPPGVARAPAPARAPRPASAAARSLTPQAPAARTRTRPPSRARRPPPRPPPRPQPGALRRVPTRPRAHGPRPRALPSPPRSRGRRAALLLLSPSRMVAAAAAATQTLGSGGRAPRPEVTFLAASARAAPPLPSLPPFQPPPRPRRSRKASLATPPPAAAGPPPALWCGAGAPGWHFRTRLGHGSSGHALWRCAPRGFAPRPLPGQEARARPVRRRLPGAQGGAPRPRAGLSRLRRRAVGVEEGGGQGHSATPGPPVVSIVVTPSVPAPPAAAGARAPGGLSRRPPWSLLFWTDRFRRRPRLDVLPSRATITRCAPASRGFRYIE